MVRSRWGGDSFIVLGKRQAVRSFAPARRVTGRWLPRQLSLQWHCDCEGFPVHFELALLLPVARCLRRVGVVPVGQIQAGHALRVGAQGSRPHRDGGALYGFMAIGNGEAHGVVGGGGALCLKSCPHVDIASDLIRCPAGESCAIHFQLLECKASAWCGCAGAATLRW